MNRYDVNPNEDYQPGSKEVLKNYLNTTDKDLIAFEETLALQKAYQFYTQHLNEDDPITTKLILAMHKKWLGDIYPFAGKFRAVHMSKGDFPFAAPAQPDRLMADFEKVLKEHTPCNNASIVELISSLAVIHVEFILIHPFREGNGRLGRMIAYIMALQAGLPPLNFSSIDDKHKNGHNEYIKAIHAGLDNNYDPMKDIFKNIVYESLNLN